MALILVKVTNKLGEFVGSLDLPANSTKEEAVNMARSIITDIDNAKWLSISHSDGSATVFPQTILRESVVNLKVSD